MCAALRRYWDVAKPISRPKDPTEERLANWLKRWLKAPLHRPVYPHPGRLTQHRESLRPVESLAVATPKIARGLRRLRTCGPASLRRCCVGRPFAAWGGA